MTKKQLDLLKSTVDKDAKKLDDAIKILRRCEKALNVAHKVVDRLEAKIEINQLKIEKEIGGPWNGDDV